LVNYRSSSDDDGPDRHPFTGMPHRRHRDLGRADRQPEALNALSCPITGLRDAAEDAVIERLTKLAPLERMGQPEDIANAVAFLAGPDGAWINGQVLRANGGII
jgi:NAD(P)-dependent dehydrogenase (short-subunit alcohol dehydrogenase family)